MNDEDFRDVCAIFAMHAILNKDVGAVNIGVRAYAVADTMLDVRNEEPEQEVGIVAAKPRRKKVARD